MKIKDILLKNSRDQVVLTTFNGDFTTKDILDRVDYYITFFKNEDLTGKKIGLLVPFIPEYLSLVLAVNQLGGTVVPLSWQFRKEDLTAVLKFLNPHIVFTITEFNSFSFGDVFKTWAEKSKKEVIIYQSTDCREWDMNTITGSIQPLEKDKIDFICCSSGSTGTPKGMVVSSETFNFTFEYFNDIIEIKESDCLFLNAPPTTVFGISALLNGIYNGCKVVFPDNFELTKMIKLMEENNCNKLISTPSIFKAIYQVAEGINPQVVKSIEVVGLAGEMVRENYVNLFNLMNDCKFVGMYGSSEIGGAMYCDLRGKIEFNVYKGIDYQINNNELLLKSPASFSYYYKNPELTKEVIDQKGWFYTGDLVQENDNGKIEIIGRKKDMIKKGGQQVIPGEIEQLLAKHEKVKQAVVIGAPHHVFGEQIVAFVVPNEKINNKEELYSYCSSNIARYKVPDHIEIIAEIPVSQGKVDKVSLNKLINRNMKE